MPRIKPLLQSGALVFGVLGVWLVPALARACPMCFSGNGTNQSAFLWGSVMLMLVPTVAIGSLLYWAYSRAKAIDAEATQDAARSDASAAPQAVSSGGSPTLRVVSAPQE